MSVQAHTIVLVTTALYRRYRPDTFGEVIGQEHVTEPLMAALRTGRVTHAYLFSGPRGCGKTTSARIFARCLNCAEGPTDTPCGTCDSCRELARGGSGSLDVVEIDAASHNGVDDARELRERAAFAPARDRYKIFILDEAHMVTTQGFNALLKLVEEPPDHVKFIFATTEPEKVIGTIRSRTHHYPFRLVPPRVLTAYLERLCGEESVSVGPGVLPMVVRAGAGSVRDSLSVLDQLIAGAPDGELNYERAAALLGFTSASLLDDAVEALAARDGAALFRVVDDVVSSGHDPRRFVEDLLERLRDLVIVALAGEAAEPALASTPPDQLERIRLQARHLGAASSSRAADLVNAALSEMSGATSPRLQLELLCARLLLPAADPDGGLAPRVERLEQVVSGAATGPVASSASSAPVAAAPGTAESAASAVPSRETPPPTPPASPQPVRPTPPTPGPPAPAPAPGSAEERRVAAARQASATLRDRAAAPPPPGLGTASPASPSVPPADRPPSDPGVGASPDADSALVRRRWGEVLETLGRIRRTSWALVARSATVGEINDGVMTLIFETDGLCNAFRSGRHDENVVLALSETLGIGVRVRAVTAGETASTPHPPAQRGPEPAPREAPIPEGGSTVRGPQQATPQQRSAPTSRPAPGGRSTPSAQTAPPAKPAPGGPSTPPARPIPSGRSTPAHGLPPAPAPGTPAPAASPTAPGRTPSPHPRAAPSMDGRPADPDDDESPDDRDAEDSGLLGVAVIERVLGGRVISEEPL